MTRSTWYTFYQQQLQSRYEQQNELLQRLLKDYAIVTDPLVKFEREQQIEDTKTEIERIKHNLSLLETALSSGDDRNVPSQYKRKPKAENRERENLFVLLQRVKDAWIEGVLKQSLHNEVLIELRKERQDNAVDKLNYPFNLTLQRAEMAEESPVLQGAIREIYEEGERTLLILGAPGAGKTITLLDLTRQLANDATFDANQAIPVIFNLSSWTNKRQPLADWLVDELLTKYRIPTKIGHKWVEDVENHPLALMLDGLDEVTPGLQSACVQAINTFREKYALNGIVVACREKEYNDIASKLKLEQALTVKPLTNQQIADYLNAAGTDLDGLRAALPKDGTLRELASSPLMLSMMSLAYQNQPPETIRQDIAENTDARRNNLFATYVQRMFQRPRHSVVYDENKTRRWLTYLAHNMHKHGQTIFQIENLQPGWLLTKTEFWLYAMLSRLWGGLLPTVGLLLLELLQSGDIASLYTERIIILVVAGMLTTVPVGLINGRHLNWTRHHQSIYGLRWIVLDILLIGLAVTLIAALGISIYAQEYAQEDFIAIVFGAAILFGFPIGLFYALWGRKQTILRDVQPVENVRWMWRRFILIFLGGIVLGGLHFIQLDLSHLTMYNVQTGQQTILREQTTPVEDVAFSPNSDMIVTIDNNGKLTVWMLEKQPHVAWSQEGTIVVKEAENHVLVVFRRGGDLLTISDNNFRWVEFSPEGNLIVTTDYATHYNYKKTLWTQEGQQVKTFGDNLRQVTFSPNGDLIFTLDEKGLGALWTREGRSLKIFGEHLREVAFSSDGNLIVSINYHDKGILWRREGHKITDLGEHIWKVFFSQNSDLCVTIDRYHKGTLWTREGQLLSTFGEDLEEVAFSPDGTMIVAGFSDRWRRFVNWTVWTKEGDVLKVFGDNLRKVTFSPDSDLVATVNQNGKMTVLTREGEQLNIFGEHLQWIDFSADSTMVVAQDDSRKKAIWTREGHKLTIFGDNLRYVEFSPDSTLIATVDQSRTETVWTREGRKLADLGGNFQDVNFSPDGSYVVLSSAQYNFGPLAILWGAVAFLVGLFTSIRTNAVEHSKNKPNKGIWLSLKNSLLLGLGVGMIVGLIFLWGEWKFVFLTIGQLNAFGLGMLCGLPVAMWFGLLGFLQHFTLRLILWRRGYTPWRYARFLDYATDRIFLRKVGGGYIFAHRLLLEYFATQWKDEPLKLQEKR